jgi:hypothetical protein
LVGVPTPPALPQSWSVGVGGPEGPGSVICNSWKSAGDRWPRAEWRCAGGTALDPADDLLAGGVATAERAAVHPSVLTLAITDRTRRCRGRSRGGRWRRHGWILSQRLNTDPRPRLKADPPWGGARTAGGRSLALRWKRAQEGVGVVVEQYDEIRRMHAVEGLSIKEICRRTGRNRSTVRRALRSEGPAVYRRRPVVSKLEPHSRRSTACCALSRACRPAGSASRSPRRGIPAARHPG